MFMFFQLILKTFINTIYIVTPNYSILEKINMLMFVARLNCLGANLQIQSIFSPLLEKYYNDYKVLILF